MTYTSNLHLLNVEISTNNSSISTVVNTDFIPAMVNNMGYLDKYLAGYYTYNIITDANFTITADFLYLKLSDTNTILTNTRTLTIVSNSIKQIRIIKNATNYTIVYGSINIPSQSTYITYDNNTIIGIGRVNILDLYCYIPGLPAISTLYSIKRSIKNSILLGGYAKASAAATSNLTIDIWLNTTKVGTILFSAGSSTGLVSISGVIYISSIDNLYIKTQGIQDATLSNVGIVLNIIGE